MHCIFLCARVPYFGFLICVASHARIACFAYDRLETGLNTNPVCDGLKVYTDGRYCFMASPRRLKTTFSRNIDHRLFLHRNCSKKPVRYWYLADFTLKTSTCYGFPNSQIQPNVISSSTNKCNAFTSSLRQHIFRYIVRRS